MMILAIASLVFASCEKDSNDNTERRIDIRTDIEAMNRMPQLDNDGKGNFSTGDTFTLTVTGNANHTLKDYTVGQTALYWQDFNDIAADKVTFAGCYPGHTEDGSLTFKFNVTSATNADLLLAPAVEVPAYSKTVFMPFRHAMHKLVVKYTTDGSYTQEALHDISTTLYANTTCTVDLSKGIITEHSAEAPANYAPQNGTDVSWLVVPQNTDKVKLNISLNGQTCNFTLPETTTDGQQLTNLEGGKTLTLTILVSKNGISFGNIEIGGWEEQGSAEGDIIM